MNTRNKIVVVGSGYVGMSLATMLSKKYQVCVLDIDEIAKQQYLFLDIEFNFLHKLNLLDI